MKEADMPKAVIPGAEQTLARMQLQTGMAGWSTLLNKTSGLTGGMGSLVVPLATMAADKSGLNNAVINRVVQNYAQPSSLLTNEQIHNLSFNPSETELTQTDIQKFKATDNNWSIASNLLLPGRLGNLSKDVSLSGWQTIKSWFTPSQPSLSPVSQYSTEVKINNSQPKTSKGYETDWE